MPGLTCHRTAPGLVYSSYLGRQWQQLWVLPVAGGYPFPLTYGDYDNTSPRWSPDGRMIAFISNRSGNTALWLVDAVSGEQRPLPIAERRYPPAASGAGSPGRRRGRKPDRRARSPSSTAGPHSYAPDEAWMHADDMLVPERQPIETRYFHSAGRSRISVPIDRLTITVSHGPAYEVARLEEDARVGGWARSAHGDPAPSSTALQTFLRCGAATCTST